MTVNPGQPLLWDVPTEQVKHLHISWQSSPLTQPVYFQLHLVMPHPPVITWQCRWLDIVTMPVHNNLAFFGIFLLFRNAFLIVTPSFKEYRQKVIWAQSLEKWVQSCIFHVTIISILKYQIHWFLFEHNKCIFSERFFYCYLESNISFMMIVISMKSKCILCN